ncbi:hypothetical protein PC129_g24830, partial [Phytophthora cactorum]
MCFLHSLRSWGILLSSIRLLELLRKIAEVSMQSFNIYMPHAASANELNAP